MERMSTVMGEARHKFLSELIDRHRPEYEPNFWTDHKNYYTVRCKACHLFGTWRVGDEPWTCPYWMTADQLGLLRAFDLVPVEVPT